MDYQKLLPSLLSIAREAGAAILAIYNRPELFAIEKKEDQSPLTAADTASNHLICRHLKALTPHVPIISEENKEAPWSERRHWKRCWLVDPLDGTKEFIKRNGDFTVNIALVESGAPVLGVMYAPVHGELVWAVKGKGCFSMRNSECGVRSAESSQRDSLAQSKTITFPHPEREAITLRAATFRWADEGLTIAASRSHLNPETEGYITRFKNPILTARGSALKFIQIARGEAQVYPRLGPTMEWDTAAPQIIVEEAGGQVVRIADGQPMTYNKENLLNPWFAAFGIQLPENSPRGLGTGSSL